jgi:hypothetical protein
MENSTKPFFGEKIEIKDSSFFYVFDDSDMIQVFIVCLSHLILFNLLLAVIEIIRFEKFSPDRRSTLINKLWLKGMKHL